MASVEGLWGVANNGGDMELARIQRSFPRSADEEQRESLLRGGPDDEVDQGVLASETSPDAPFPAKELPVTTAVKSKGPLAAWLDSLSPRLKFVLLVSCVFFFFGLHNILQEAVFHMDGFNFGWALGLLEASGVLVGSTLERMHGGQGVCKRVAPFTSYFVLAGLLGISSALSNIALNYIQYPTKVIFRSCKLIPTMVIAVVWRKKVVSKGEFVAASAVCAGLVIFAQADAKLEPDFDPRGIILVLVSVCADAFLPNMQEQVFSTGASRVEVTFFSNALAVVGILVFAAPSGDLFKFISYGFNNTWAMLHMLVYTVLSHVAISSYMMVVKEYGGVTAVLVGNARKTMTIALSFILFPKPFSYHFVVGGVLVFTGLAFNVMIKGRRNSAKAAKNYTPQPHRAGRQHTHRHE